MRNEALDRGASPPLGGVAQRGETPPQLQLFTNSTNYVKTSDDYYTPPEVFQTLDLEFDLDVAAPPGGIPWIPAKRYFTIEDDALSQPWTGRIWMNPPFSKPSQWIDRFIEHGNGVGLVCTSRARWFAQLWGSQAALIHPHAEGTMFQFIRDGKRTNIYMPVIFIALGQDNIQAASRLGRVR